MSLDEKFIPVRNAFYEIVGNFFRKTAGFFGYPNNPGMPTISNRPKDHFKPRFRALNWRPKCFMTGKAIKKL